MFPNIYNTIKLNKTADDMKTKTNNITVKSNRMCTKMHSFNFLRTSYACKARTLTLFVLLLVTLMLSAQTGEITGIKILGIDEYPSGIKFRANVNIHHSSLEKDQAYLIIYADTAPLTSLEENVTYNKYGILTGKYCNGHIILPSSTQTQAKTYTVLIPIKYKRLKDILSDNFYIRAVLLDNKNGKVMHLSQSIQVNATTLTVTARQDTLRKRPTEQERLNQERKAQQERESNARTVGTFTKILGDALIGGSCAYCGGEGCSMCGWSGVSNSFSSGYDMVQRNTSKNSNAVKLKNGKHTEVYENGKYVGNFRKGLRDGKGTYTFTNGDKYTGDWFNGERHGYGESSTIDGFKYKGEFFHDKMDGKGTLTFPDGDKYIGHFKEDAQDGVGTIYLKADKKFIKGVWETGDLVKIIKEGPYDPTNRMSQAIKRTSSKSSSAKRQVRK